MEKGKYNKIDYRRKNKREILIDGKGGNRIKILRSASSSPDGNRGDPLGLLCTLWLLMNLLTSASHCEIADYLEDRFVT